jgi:hypothetical protein
MTEKPDSGKKNKPIKERVCSRCKGINQNKVVYHPIGEFGYLCYICDGIVESEKLRKALAASEQRIKELEHAADVVWKAGFDAGAEKLAEKDKVISDMQKEMDKRDSQLFAYANDIASLKKENRIHMDNFEALVKTSDETVKKAVQQCLSELRDEVEKMREKIESEMSYCEKNNLQAAVQAYQLVLFNLKPLEEATDSKIPASGDLTPKKTEEEHE